MPSRHGPLGDCKWAVVAISGYNIRVDSLNPRRIREVVSQATGFRPTSIGVPRVDLHSTGGLTVKINMAAMGHKTREETLIRLIRTPRTTKLGNGELRFSIKKTEVHKYHAIIPNIRIEDARAALDLNKGEIILTKLGRTNDVKSSSIEPLDKDFSLVTRRGSKTVKPWVHKTQTSDKTIESNQSTGSQSQGPPTSAAPRTHTDTKVSKETPTGSPNPRSYANVVSGKTTTPETTEAQVTHKDSNPIPNVTDIPDLSDWTFHIEGRINRIERHMGWILHRLEYVLNKTLGPQCSDSATQYDSPPSGKRKAVATQTTTELTSVWDPVKSPRAVVPQDSKTPLTRKRTRSEPSTPVSPAPKSLALAPESPTQYIDLSSPEGGSHPPTPTIPTERLSPIINGRLDGLDMVAIKLTERIDMFEARQPDEGPQ